MNPTTMSAEERERVQAHPVHTVFPGYATRTEVDALEEAVIAEFKAVNERLININTQAMMEEIATLKSDLAKLITYVSRTGI